ncbi:MAG: single-stranded-DNA-specific exonuclease RecJ [candidate division WOR-3 bacterium]
MKEWILLDQTADMPDLPGIPGPVLRVLKNRGYNTKDAIERFLNPELKYLNSPFLFADMERAVERIVGAQRAGEKILVYGDYDADGITATAMLIQFLKGIGIDAGYYIPHRIIEGYGLSTRGVEFAREHKFSVLITVDCGTSSVAEIDMARAAGIDVIVCDHHEPGEILPQPFVFLNPKLVTAHYPFKELSGAGVVFKMIQALSIYLNKPELAEDYLDLCALGTVVDVAPLIDENRILVRFGLERMARTENIGLERIIDRAGLKNKMLTPYHLSFIIGPRINAGGRMAEATIALKLFLTEDHQEAGHIASRLEEENQRRQQIEDLILNEALYLIDEEKKDRNRVVVLAREGWHEGVIGIVASRIVERFYRPAFLIALKDKRGKGSGRSIPGFHLAQALKYCQQELVSYGGHKQAAGLVIEQSKIDGFETRINEYASQFPEDLFTPRTYIDTKISLAEIDYHLVEFLKKFEPTGIENPTPTFLGERLEVVGYPRVVANSHLRFALREKKKALPAIGYGMGEKIVGLKVGQTRIDAVFTIDEDSFQGKRRIMVKLKEIRESQGVAEGE